MFNTPRFWQFYFVAAFALGLLSLSTQSNSQEAKEINANTPISFSADSIKSLAWIDESGALEVNKVLEKLSDFQDAKNFPDKIASGKIWRLFNFRNTTKNEIKIQILLTRTPDAILAEIEKSNLKIIRNTSIQNKNHITHYNLYANGGRTIPSRTMYVTLQAESESKLLIGAPRLRLDEIEFSDPTTHAEWSRGFIYLQGILIGAMISLFALAIFSAYKYQNPPSYWYAAWLTLQVVSIATEPISGDGSRLSEFFLNNEHPEFYFASFEFSNVAYLIFCYQSLKLPDQFPKFKNTARIILGCTALAPILMFIATSLEIKIKILTIAIAFSYLLARLLTLLFAYLAFKSHMSGEKSGKYIGISLLLFLFANTGVVAIHHLFDYSPNLLYSEVEPNAFINSLNIFQAILMGWSTISHSKNIQDQLLHTTEERNRLISDQNQVLEERVIVRTRDLQLQTEKTEKLMLNILPQSIAERLKDGDKEVSDKYQNTTILFSDLVGFTKMSSEKTPEELVFLLNDLFKRFDIRALSLGLEKIKTIGDAYMVVGGLPTVDDTHAIRVTKMALGMYEDLAEFNAQHGVRFDMRIGINSGPVVAGVIGHSKFSYDLWGNAVNTASRMESTSVPGKIQVSPSTFEQIKGHFDVQEHQLVECKGLGQIMTYFVNGQLPASGPAFA
jgi:class 3 adenylate cyclase